MEPEDEILEVVDTQGRVLGRATRGDCHSDKSLLHRAVHVFVLDRQGRIFLQKRSMQKRIQPGRWDASVGGHVDPGETPEQAAVREMDEELGCFIPERPEGARGPELGVSGVELELLHEYVWRSPVESELVSTFRCVHEGPFTLKADEIDEGRFFSLDELRALVGTGQLTPNLEHELVLLGIVAAPAE